MKQIITDFTAQSDGFRFVNSFAFSREFKLPFLAHPIDLGHLAYGLCGGMSFAALDYFNAGNPVPKQGVVPNAGTALYQYLMNRQIDSLSLPVVPLKIIEWMLRPDPEVGSLTAQREFPKLRRRLDGNTPAVLALVRAQGIADPTQNHQVVARGYDFDETTKQVTIYLYDPNHPGQEPTLTMNFARPSQGINPTQSTGEPLRGFFVLDYDPRKPPASGD
jgi:hypothetical protein